MPDCRWFRFAPLVFVLAACAQSASLDEGANADDDAGIQWPVDDADGGKDASKDSGPADSGGGDSATTDDAGACEGVVCDSPPADSCEDASTLRTYVSVGSCEEGECSYASTTEDCGFGCEGSECKPNPCEGKVCNSPPAKTCADANTLRVYEAVGTCNSAGECSYAGTTQDCPKGCAQGACIDDPCIGVSCNSPPSPECQDESALKVYESSGSCGDDGECSYTSQPSFCAFGCVAGACKDDPCSGVVCNSPPANRCKDQKHLEVYDPPGSCSLGTCTYPEPREIYCEFDCVNGACKDDPCAGKACNTPPARDCKDANTARIYASTGSCSGGLCSYQVTETPCAYGCVNGVCKNCTEQAGCGAGEWCNSDSCSPCNNDFHCGASCMDCGAFNKKCHQGSCVECTNDGQCGSGKRCENNACVACDSSAACGASCAPCSGNTPICNGAQCVCDATSCGPGAMCTGTGCVDCDTAASCGPSCGACSGATPVCGGKTVGCVCTEASCGEGSYCAADGSCASCGAGACGNGRCDCGETSASCPSDCGPPCPVGLVIGDWTSGNDGWVYEKHADGTRNFWRLNAGFMGGGSGSSPFTKAYTQDLTYGSDVNLTMCASATLKFDVKLSQDTGTSSGNNRERLNVQCSGDGGASFIDMTPNPWPSKQGGCNPSYCTGTFTTDQSFNWTAQTITLPAACRTARARFRFQATGVNAYTMHNPGWSVRNVKVN